MNLKIKLLPNAEAPYYSTEGSAGFDLSVHSFKQYYDNRTNPESVNKINVVNVEGQLAVLMNPHSRLLIGCGFHVAIPKGYELQIRSRSGVALKQGLIVLNAPGTIDEDYRGEVGVILCNNSLYAVSVQIGDRIAQAVLAEYSKTSFEVVESLDETLRGEGGYGHTGTN